MTAKIKFAKFCAISVILPAVACDRVLESTLYRACVHIIDHFRPTERCYCQYTGDACDLDDLSSSIMDRYSTK